MKPIIITGKTGSGKSTILKKFINMGFVAILEYTTRPIRSGEVDRKDYYFITDEKYLEMRRKDMFIEDKQYNTKFGCWRYGAVKSDFEKENRVIVMGGGQFEQILEKNVDTLSVYLRIDEEEIFKRLEERDGEGSEISEIQRRLNADREIYERIDGKTTITVDVNLKTPDDIVSEITEKLCMKMWLDDIRQAPPGYCAVKSVNEAKKIISQYGVPCIIDFDHDAGKYASDGGDYISLMNWLEYMGYDCRVAFHTMNPVGRKNMEMIAKKNHWQIYN